jgi:transposase-like protein
MIDPNNSRHFFGRDGLASHYADLLSKQEASHLSMREFAAQHGVSACTLYQWKRRLSSDPNAERGEVGSLVAVDVIKPADAPTRAESYELSFANGISLRLPRDFEVARVGELVALVR